MKRERARGERATGERGGGGGEKGGFEPKKRVRGEIEGEQKMVWKNRYVHYIVFEAMTKETV